MSVELRKNKKDDMLSKRRNVATDDEPLSPLQVTGDMAIQIVVPVTIIQIGFLS